MAFLSDTSVELLEANGEYVGAAGAHAERAPGCHGGPDAAPVTSRRPLARTSDLVGGLVHDRRGVATSSRSKLRGLRPPSLARAAKPLYEWIDVHAEVMYEAAPDDRPGVSGEPSRAASRRGPTASAPCTSLRPRGCSCAGMVRRGEDFDAAEDALQEALLEALRVWPGHPPRDPRAWLVPDGPPTRRSSDARRSEVPVHRREEATYAESAAPADAEP